jgi:hypothetical protein
MYPKTLYENTKSLLSKPLVNLSVSYTITTKLVIIIPYMVMFRVFLYIAIPLVVNTGQSSSQYHIYSTVHTVVRTIFII